MDPFLDLVIAAAVGAAALVGLAVALVVVIAKHGRKLSRHADWQRVMELRVNNLHEERRRRDVMVLQTVRPPPLSEAKTVEISEAMLETQLIASRKREGEP